MVNLNKCVICGKSMSEKYEPFCSKRCKDVDFGKWMKGSYNISAHKNANLIKQNKPES